MLHAYLMPPLSYSLPFPPIQSVTGPGRLVEEWVGMVGVREREGRGGKKSSIPMWRWRICAGCGENFIHLRLY